MSSIKVKGFLKDVQGSSKVIKLRSDSFVNASPVPNPSDFIKDIADQLHPSSMKVKVIDIFNVSPTSKTFRFESTNGWIPVFQSGQYVNFRLHIGSSILTRPYSISSAPYEARKEHPFFDVTIRRNRSYLVPDYFFENVKVGDEMDANLPFGYFYYEPLRDSKELVAIAGGSGVTPFYSLAKEIAYGKLNDVSLTILYGSVKSDDILFYDAFEKITKDCERVKVIHVLSDDPSWNGEKGFVNADIIQKYSTEDCTYMFSGPLAMYHMVKDCMKQLNIREKRFRHDVIPNPADITKAEGYPLNEIKTFHITVKRGMQEDIIEANSNESVAVALERNAILINTHCRNGECGMCRSKLISGEIYVPKETDGRRMMDKEMHYFHACSSWPLSDLVIQIPIM